MNDLPPALPDAEQPIDRLIAAVLAVFPEATPYERPSDCPGVTVPVEHLLACMTLLRNRAEFNFDFLFSHTAVDRFPDDVIELVYLLDSISQHQRLLVSATVPRANPIAPTVSSVWPIAEWQEREVFDLFGVQYENHPDLRRLFLEDDWVGFPLRKDYEDDFMLDRNPSEVEQG